MHISPIIEVKSEWSGRCTGDLIGAEPGFGDVERSAASCSKHFDKNLIEILKVMGALIRKGLN